MTPLFKISPSNIHKICTGAVGLTETQQSKYDELTIRKFDPLAKALTANMEEELKKLIYKKENPTLPDGAITYLKEWHKSKRYKRKKEWFNKAVDKGLAVEPIAIEMLSVYWDEGIEFLKNEDYYSNEYVHGFPDVHHKPAKIVFDTKSAWDVFTFPSYEDEPDDKQVWQMHGYNDICNAETSFLVHCLINTPKPLIDLELKKLYYQSGGSVEDWNPDTYEALRKNYCFDDIPIQERIKLFEVRRDESKIKFIHERVKLCRKYIEVLDKKFMPA